MELTSVDPARMSNPYCEVLWIGAASKQGKEVIHNDWVQVQHTSSIGAWCILIMRMYYKMKH